MKNSYKVALTFLFLGSVVLQSDIIVPDRPGFSTGTYTVQPKNINVELGYNYTKNDETLPLIVLRTGLTDKLELDIMYDGFDIKHNDQKKFTWSSDLIIGGKYRLLESELYNLIFWDYTLFEDISLFGTLQGSTYYDIERVYDFQPAVGISFTHTDKLVVIYNLI